MFNQTTMKTAMSQPKNHTANRLEIQPQNSQSDNPVCKFEPSQKDESRAQSADSLKVYRKGKAFN